MRSDTQGNDIFRKYDATNVVQEMTNDIQQLRDKKVYELNGAVGVPKCCTLADRMQKNLNTLVECYENAIEVKSEAADREQFDLLSGLLVALAREIADLSKKQPDGLVNSFKVGQINRVLVPLKAIMESEPSSQFLDIVAASAPDSKTDISRNTYSDTAVILSQFREACGEYPSKHYSSRWSIDL